MANKSSKSPSGEEGDHKNEHIRKQEPHESDIKSNAGEPVPKMAPKKQENLENRGYEEDQPNNPVRNSGSTQKEQETMPAGEPDSSDGMMKNNQTGPGLG